jgi:hypothetical protein
MRLPLFVAIFALFGCGSSTSGDTPATDSAVTITDTGSTPADTGSVSDTKVDAACDIGMVPTVANYTHEFVFVGGEAGGMVPTPTGGDPVGEWRHAKLTIYLSEGAKMFVDTSKSSVDGKGFSSYTATSFRNTSEQITTLETTVVGTVKRGTSLKAKGTWKMMGNEIVFTPECAESTAEGKLEKIGWSRIDADHARMQFKPAPTGMGDFVEQIVIDLEKIK